MRVLIACGGSGGHIFPAIALGQELKKRGVEPLFIASKKRIDRTILQKKDFKKVFIDIRPMPGGFSLSIFGFIVKFIFGLISSFVIIKRFKPNVVIGFGGFVSAAVILVSCILKRPTIIHEQNLILGRANRFLSNFVDRIAVSFRETERHMKGKKAIFTGNPLRPDLINNVSYDRELALNRLGLDKSKFTILVMGGSQAAHFINEIFSRSIVGLGFDKLNKLQVIHLTGEDDFDYISAIYKRYDIKNRVFTFSEDMASLYSGCDLAIARAGATTIAEIAHFAKPAILIPYQYARSHQENNAILLAKKKAAILMEQSSLSVESMRSQIDELIGNKRLLAELSGNIKGFDSRDAAGRLADEVLKLAKKATN